MTNTQLIEKLKKLPPDLIVYSVDSDGCHDCNPEGMPNYHEVDEVKVREEGMYPYYTLRNVIELT